MTKISAKQTQIRRVEVSRLFQLGKTQKEIAEELGVHRNTITNDIRKLQEDAAASLKGSNSTTYMSACFDLYKELIQVSRACTNHLDKIAALREAKELLLHKGLYDRIR